MDKVENPDKVEKDLDPEDVRTYSKIIDLLKSGLKDNINLAMNVLKSEHPALWVALLGYTGSGDVTEDLVKHLAIQGTVGIGHKVRYRGLDDGPAMIITNLQLKPQKTVFGNSFYTEAVCKYFNKSTQSFVSITERLECFEIL